MNKVELWKAVLGELELSLSRANFSIFLATTYIVEIKEIDKQRQLIKIATPNPFHRETIENRYYGQIKEILDRLTKKKNEPVFVIKTRPIPIKTDKTTDSGPLFQQKTASKSQVIKKAIVKACLRPDFTFANFAVSSTNEMAYAATQAVAEKPGAAYHLLFLYGGVGVGKTHLMQAVGRRILEKNPETALVYCTSEEFTNEIIGAIRQKSTGSFRKKYRSAKVLLIDDIQFIAGKNTVQEEFFHTFNTIQSIGGQIIMTSDELPETIKGLEDRLRSRFEGGLMVDIQEPNFELRTAILLIKAQSANIPLPMDVAQLIAANVESTRRLEGTLMRLGSESQAKKQPITPEMAQAVLGKVGQRPEKKIKATPIEIIEVVSNYYQLKIQQVRGKRRLKHLADARHIAMYIIRTELKTPVVKIGQIFSGRDHTSVLHAVKKITKELTISEQLRLDMAAIKQGFF
ncbi:chromosomal replication initiator protein DnaA [Patescibacteria group bacterium]|nr:chromosomal replication initiator protein DnaA [Patescibacteria group bacterium]MBU1931829.1 chromosomal replication initiator protein DnaA [Patescibacteria group bacterium]